MKKFSHTIDIINQLKNQGYNIKYSKRSDGGYLIRSINGAKFQGAEGNKVARQLTGQALPEHLQKQRQQALKKRVSYYSELDEETRKQLRKVQKTWREYKKAGGQSKKSRLTAKQVAKSFKKYGKADTMKFLGHIESYAKGYTFPENVDMLIERIKRQQMNEKSHQSDWNPIIQYLEANRTTIQEYTQFEPMKNVLYDYIEKHLYTQNEAIRQIKIILKI